MKSKSIIKQTLLTENAELDESFIKKAALAGLLGLATHAGLDYTSSKNTPLGQAMQAAAEQGDDYAAYHLERLDLYADAGASKIMTKLSNKYLGPYKTRSMNETTKKKSKLHEAVIDRLRYIVDNNQRMRVTFDNGEILEVDLFTASAIVNLHNAVSDTNKTKIEEKISKNKDMFFKIADFAFSASRSKETNEQRKYEISENSKSDWNVDALVKTALENQRAYNFNAEPELSRKEIKQQILDNRKSYEKMLTEKVFYPVNHAVFALDDIVHNRSGKVENYLAAKHFGKAELEFLRKILKDLESVNRELESSSVVRF